jgi:plasmid maintenance system killer protein
MRIVSFRHKGLERFWRDNDWRGLPPRCAEKIRAMPTAIAEAENLGKIERYSGWRLHALTGDRRGTWSMIVTRNYRLTFRVVDLTVAEINLEDYHGR